MIPALDHFLGILAVGLTAFFVARTWRTFKFVQPYLERGVKPWACNVCMGWWNAVLVALVVYAVQSGAVEAFFSWRPWSAREALQMYWLDGFRWFLYAPPAAALAMLLLDHYAGLPHELPDMDDDDDKGGPGTPSPA